LTKFSKQKLIILQTVIPDYRRNLFFYIKKKLSSSFELYGGDYYFEKSVKSDTSITFRNHIKNIYIFNRRFLFQIGMWPIVFRSNVLVIELNPRIISNWVILLIRKVINKKTILWGHAWPRLGSNSKTDRIRGFMRNFADIIIVYTATQRKELQEKMPNAKILFAPNSIYFKEEMSTHQKTGEIKNVVYVGRLTQSKKPLLLVKAFHKVIKKIPCYAQLIIVGEGEEKELIINYIERNGLNNRISVLGHVSNYSSLKALYDTALFSVSPGYVGLSITQSFSFGVPMLISKDEPHSPELEAVVENENTMFFKTDNIDALSDEIIRFFEQKEEWINRRYQILEFCKNNYSIEAMAKSFIKVALNS